MHWAQKGSKLYILFCSILISDIHLNIVLPSIPMFSVSSLSFMLPHQNTVDIYLLLHAS